MANATKNGLDRWFEKDTKQQTSGGSSLDKWFTSPGSDSSGQGSSLDRWFEQDLDYYAHHNIGTGSATKSLGELRAKASDNTRQRASAPAVPEQEQRRQSERETATANRSKARTDYSDLLIARDSVREQADALQEEYDARIAAGEREEDLADIYAQISDKRSRAAAYDAQAAEAFGALKNAQKSYKDVYADYNAARKELRAAEWDYQNAMQEYVGPEDDQRVKDAETRLASARMAFEEQGGNPDASIVGASMKQYGAGMLGVLRYGQELNRPENAIKLGPVTIGGGDDRMPAEMRAAIEANQKADYEEKHGAGTWKPAYQRTEETAARLQRESAEDLASIKAGRSELAQFGVDAASQGVQMGVDAAAGLVLPGGSLTAMALRTFGASAQEAKDEGATLAQQGLYGASTAAVEVLTEKLGGMSKVYGANLTDGIISHAIGKFTTNRLGQAALGMVADAAGEGLEEVISDLANPVLKSIYDDHVFDNGYFGALDASEVLYDFLVGAALGMAGGSVESVSESTGLSAPDARSEYFMEAGQSGMTFAEALESWKALQETVGDVGAQVDAAFDVLTGKETTEQQQMRQSDALQKLGFTKAQTEAAINENRYEAPKVISTREMGRVYGDAQKKLAAEGVTNDRLAEAITTVALQKISEEQDTAGNIEPSKLQQKLVSESDLAQRLVAELVSESNQRATDVSVSEEDLKNVEYDGNNVRIVGIENGKVQIEQGGSRKSVSYSELSNVPESYGQLVQAATERKNGNEMLRAYHSDQNVDAYIRAWDFAVDIFGAQTKATIEQARKSPVLTTLTDAQLDLALAIGRQHALQAAQTAQRRADTYREIRKQAKKTEAKKGAVARQKGTVSYKGGTFNGETYKGVERSKLSRSQKKNVAMIERLADVLHYDFVVYEGEPNSGGVYLSGGTILVNIRAGELSEKTLTAASLSHELTHSFKERSPAEYEQLKDFIVSHILEKSTAQFEKLVQQQMDLNATLDHEGAVDELVANACQTMLRDSKAITQLARQNMTLAEKIADVIEDLTTKIKEAFEGVDLRDDIEVYDAARAIEDAYDEVLALWDKALTEAAENDRAETVTGIKNPAPKSEAKYQKTERDEILHLKEQVRSNLDELKEMPVLATVESGFEFDENNIQAAVAWIVEQIGDPLTVTRDGFGDVEFNKKRINKGFNYMPGKKGDKFRNPVGQALTTSCVAAPEIVKHGKLIEHHRNHKGYGFPTWTFAGPVEIDGEPGILTVVVKKTSGLFYSVHSILTPNGELLMLYNKKAEASDGGASQGKGVAPSKLSAKYIVADISEKSKEQNQKLGIGETAEEREARRESVSNLKAENRILRARAEYWKGQTQQTRERTVRQQDTDRLANDLLREFESRADKAEVKAALKKLGDWLVQSDGDTLSYDELRERAHAIAEDIVDGNYALIDDSQSEMLGRLKDYLKSTPVNLSAADWRDTGDEHFRRRYGRYFTVSERGRTIDSLWGELSATFGESLFPEDTYAPGDMLNMIGDYLDLWKPQYGNVFEQYRVEAVEAATNEILDRVLSEDVRQTAATYADRVQQKLNAQIVKDKAKLDALRGAKNARIEEIKREAAEKNWQIRLAEKAMKYEAVDKVKQHYRDMMQRQRGKRTETAGQRKYRAQVAEKAKRLEKMLLTNSDKMHVPEVLKAPLADFLSSIDFSSKSKLKGKAETRADVKFQAALTALSDVLGKQELYLNGEENAEDRLGGYLDISPEAMDFLRETTEEIHGMMRTGETYTVNAMSAEQLQGLSKLLSNISSAIRNMNSFMANERYATVKEAADADIRYMESLGSASEIERGSVVSALAWENGTPYYVLKRFGEGGKAVFDSFARGWEKMAFNVKKIIDFTEKAYTDKEVKAWKSEIHDITLSDSSQIRITSAQIMALSQLLGREQAMKHIEKGGIRVGNIKGKVGEIVDTKHYHLTAEDISSILGELTPRQMAVAKALQRFMAHQGAIWGNEVSMRRFGYNFYDEGESYYPIRTDSNDRGMQDTEAMQNSMFRLLNLSASKSLSPKASNALIVEDIFDTFADHMADMAKLNGMGLPVLDAIKWFNYKDRIDLDNGEYDTRTLQGAMEQAFGDQAQKYFRTLMKDINGVTEAGDRGTGLLAGLMSNYKAAAVGANLRVAFLQPTSYVRASAIIQPKYLAFAFTNRNAYKEALANSGTAVWKSLGYYDTNISRGMREQIEHNDSAKDKIVKASMSLAELGDKLTWGRLWVACKMQAKATNNALEGKALIDATGDLFREVIYATQVMDSTLTRSELMRGKTLYSKAMTAFMAEPTLSYNLLMDAVSGYHLDVKANGKQGAWRRNSAKLGSAFGVYAASAAFAAVVESVADAFRDDDNDEFWQKFLEALLGEGVTARIRGEKTTESILASLMSGNLAQDLTIIGKLPYVKSMYSTLQGYKSKDMASAAIDAILDAVKIWQETAWLANGKLDKPTKVTYYGNMTEWGKIYKSLQGISQLSGIGAANLTRDVLALWNTTVGAVRPDWKIKTYESKAERTYLEKVYPHGVSWSDYQSAVSAMDTDENGSVKQEEAGPYLRGEIEAGRLTEEQAEAIWSAATSGKKTFAEWLKKNS